MTRAEASTALPGLDALREVLPNVIDLREHELRTYLTNSLNLRWDDADPEFVTNLGRLAGAVHELRNLTGWDVADALHMIGCRRTNETLRSDHLLLAHRQVARVLEAASDFALLVTTDDVDLAFRQPAGDPDGELRSMATESWTDIYVDAHAYVADTAYGDAPAHRPSPAFSDLLRELVENRRAG